MSYFSIKNQSKSEVTLVSNAFLDSFLSRANDAQLKVYLYLLRHCNLTGNMSISSLADFFNFTEKDILRALSYWQEKGVLKLEEDEQGNLCGISFCDLSEPPQQSNSVDSVSSAVFSPTLIPAPANTETRYSKPDYSLDQLAEFQMRENTSQLLFIAESYLGKTLSAGEIRSLLFISDKLHFSFDLIDYLLQYCVDRGKKDFRYIEKVAMNWAQAHITTPSEAQQSTSRYDKQVYTVMNALGKSALPTAKEAEYIKKWYDIYGFTSDVILEACERTVMATDKHRFEYADKILSNWKAAGVYHKSDISRADASYSSKKRPVSGNIISRNKFNQFQQNEYDFERLEEELLSN